MASLVPGEELLVSHPRVPKVPFQTDVPIPWYTSGREFPMSRFASRPFAGFPAANLFGLTARGVVLSPLEAIKRRFRLPGYARQTA